MIIYIDIYVGVQLFRYTYIVYKMNDYQGEHLSVYYDPHPHVAMQLREDDLRASQTDIAEFRRIAEMLGINTDNSHIFIASDGVTAVVTGKKIV
jgi:hypothetical protein